MSSYTLFTRALLAFLFVCVADLLDAQTAIGYYHDMDGLPIEGSVHPLVYTPKTTLTISHNSEDYEIGTVYYKSGEARVGLVKYQNKKIWFKQEGEKADKLKPIEVQALTMGIDSFFTISDFHVERGKNSSHREGPEFVQYISSIKGHVFARHFDFATRIGTPSHGSKPTTETFLIKPKSEKVWRSFPKTKKEFESFATRYFGDVPQVSKYILANKNSSVDVFKLIKMAEYHECFRKRLPIYFNSYWWQIRQKDISGNYGKIAYLRDTLWTIDYYKKGIKTASVQYSSFFPHQKEGFAITYDSLGSRLKASKFVNNTLVEASTYKGGKLITKYVLEEEINSNFALTSISYQQFGASAVRESRTEQAWQEIVEDPSGRSIKLFFSGSQLEKAYRLQDGKKIYQAIDPLHDFKYEKLQQQVAQSIQEGFSFSKAASDDVQGFLLLAVIVNDKGRIQSFKLLNELYPEVDDQIKAWAESHLNQTSPNAMRLKPYKVDGEKVWVEYVMPISFGINRFFRPSQGRYYKWNVWDQYYDNTMQQQMFMQQQRNQLPNITPPQRPGF